ncbi:hypothetical protein SDC9_191156 [bioreactor metagenome]|uniref:Uncharacterized protein n=1 Tax=bioreactor metagenome TaxID=1076179 RepID=A0A645HYC2_9ZZZZ
MREISKIYQEARRSTLELLLRQIEEEGIRGELVLVIDKPSLKEFDDDQWKKEAENMLADGMTQKEVVNFIILHYPVAKNTVKEWIIRLRQKID